jgi:hypothetical protein
MTARFPMKGIAAMGILRPTPKQKVPKSSQGTESEMIIATELVRAGYTVLTPYGYMHRYDLVIEDADGRFWRIQCKTAWMATNTDGALKFSGCSTGGKGGWKKRQYQGDVDYFAVYSPDTDKVYLVPAQGIGNECSLRLTPSKNKQEKNVKWAADYEL